MARREMGSFAQVPDRSDTQRLYHLRQYIALAVAFLDGLRVRNAHAEHYSSRRCLLTHLNRWMGLTALNAVAFTDVAPLSRLTTNAPVVSIIIGSDYGLPERAQQH